MGHAATNAFVDFLMIAWLPSGTVYVLFPVSTLKSDIVRHPRKTPAPIEEICFGSSNDVKPQPEKAYSPNPVTERGIVVVRHPRISTFELLRIMALQLSRESYIVFPLSTFISFKPVQNENAEEAMLVTLDGISKLSRFLQLKKALVLMLLTE